ncbi:MAG: SHOCT domain-containing protein [Lachnospiraceae bacterium]|nr:SHOCT domain-containing protein [Lachnospiraceae bacterium]
MGLFSREKPVCSVCGREIDFNKFKLSNGEILCQNCIQKALITPGFTYDTLKTLSSEEVKDRIDVATERKKIFDDRAASFRPGIKFGSAIWFDDRNRWFVCPVGNRIDNRVCPVLQYEDIVDFEVLEDGNSIIKGGLGKALLGGALFGMAGMIAGGTSKKTKGTCSRLQLKITTRDLDYPVIFVDFINGRDVEKSSITYTSSFKKIQEIVSKIKTILDNLEPSSVAPAATASPVLSAADEILKYKELLDIGVISQEEFDAKKSQLLNL